MSGRGGSSPYSCQASELYVQVAEVLLTDLSSGDLDLILSLAGCPPGTHQAEVRLPARTMGEASSGESLGAGEAFFISSAARDLAGSPASQGLQPPQAICSTLRR